MKAPSRKSPPAGADYPAVNTLVIWGFCAYVLIWFLQVGIRRHILGAIRIEFLTAAALSAAILVFPPRPAKPPLKPERSTLPLYIGALFLCMAFRVVFSQDPLTSMDVFRDRVVKFAFMALFISHFVRSPRGMRYFLGAFLLACAYITQESFRGALSGAMIWMNQGIPRLHGDTPLFRHPNSLAGLAIGTLPFVYFLFFAVKPRVWRLPLLGLSMTAMGCLMYSGSRTGYVALGIFGGYLWLFSKRKLQFVLAALVLSAAAWPLIPDDYKERFATIFTGKEIEGGSMDKRKQIWADAVDVFKRYPLGVGVSAFPAVRLRLFDREQDTHSLYLEVATNLGVQGALVFLLLLLKMMRMFFAAMKSFGAQVRRMEARLGAGPPGRRRLPAAGPPVQAPTKAFIDHLDDLRFLQAAALAVMGYIVIRLALGIFGHDLYEIYWWIGSGMALSLFNIDQYARRVTDRLAGDQAVPARAPVAAVP